jgi:DNA topoisomerase-1
MVLAQALYEGVDFPEGPIGLITYMRTDSPRVAEQAISEVREFISESIGKEYLPDKPNYYKPKKTAQGAHEAIRPTSVRRHPKDLEQLMDEDLFKLYELIWKRFVASQMKPAVYMQTLVNIKAGKFKLKASGSRLLFNGFSILYTDDKETSKENDSENENRILPQLIQGEKLDLIEVLPSQHFTKPPSRFSEGSLVKALEEEGIGRPSTYAPILRTLVYRDYVRRINGYFHPTELGIKVVDLLVKYFSNIVNVEFTAQIEEKLDEVEQGKVSFVKILKDFYEPFKKDLDFAHQDIKKEIVFTEDICPKCKNPLVIKWGRGGKFLSCSDFPRCRFAKPITTGVKCPEDGCNGELIERRGRRGKNFYGCINYPKCKFTIDDLSKLNKTNESKIEKSDSKEKD